MAIGTIGATLIGGAIAGAGSLAAAGKQASAAGRAADTQLQATRETNDMLRDFRGEDIERFSPFYEGGLDAYNALRFETGLGDRPEGYSGFTATPGYEFRRDQGMDATQRSVAARQGLLSGSALKGMERFGQNFATGEYNNYLGRLGGLASGGQSAAGMQAGVSGNFGTQIGQNMMQGGQAAATGITNAANAGAAGIVGATNAINQGIGQGVGAWQYQNMLNAFRPQ